MHDAEPQMRSMRRIAGDIAQSVSPSAPTRAFTECTGPAVAGTLIWDGRMLPIRFSRPNPTRPTDPRFYKSKNYYAVGSSARGR